MGVYRLLLAALVVLFHFGGLSWIAGRAAVFGFYCVSGFLIFQVLDRVYVDEARGIWRFYGNRLLRLAPLYAVYVLATLVMVRWSGPLGPLDPQTGIPILEEMESGNAALLANALTFAPRPDLVEGMPVLEFTPNLVPQGWSLGVELMCYLVAPFAVLTTRRRPRRLAIWIAIGVVTFVWAVWTAALDAEQFQSVVYKNTFTSVGVFLTGGAIYYLRRSRGQPVPFTFVALLMAVWVAVVTVRAFRLGEGPSARVFTEYVWLTIALTALVSTTRVERLKRLDTALGNLCYGVYLNHFLVAGVLLGLGADRYIDRPGTPRFGLTVLACSLLLAFVTYYAIERPFDRVRRRVRGTPAPDELARLGNPWRGRLAIGAVAAALIVLARPAGSVAARASQIGTGPMASSPEFNVRWRPDVSDEARGRIEKELGLDNVGQVANDPRHRTWTYRLRSPSYRGLRTVLTSGSVEDTSLDAAQLERLRD